MVKKDDYIRVRLSKEQKELFKRVAEIKGITMSDFVLVATEQRALREIAKVRERKLLEPRVEILERKLELTKARLDERRKNSNKIFK